MEQPPLIKLNSCFSEKWIFFFLLLFSSNYEKSLWSLCYCVSVCGRISLLCCGIMDNKYFLQFNYVCLL